MNALTNATPRVAVAPEASSLIKQIVRRQMNHSGNILLCAMEPMSEDEFFKGGVNGVSPAWSIGHLACVTDLFCGWIDVGKELPDDIHHIFNRLELVDDPPPKCDTVDRTKVSKKSIMMFFRRAQIRALRLLDEFDLTRWNQATPDGMPESLPYWGAIWEALGVHTYWHLGELSGCLPRFHGTYTLNTVPHYFFEPQEASNDDHLFEPSEVQL